MLNVRGKLSDVIVRLFDCFCPLGGKLAEQGGAVSGVVESNSRRREVLCKFSRRVEGAAGLQSFVEAAMGESVFCNRPFMLEASLFEILDDEIIQTVKDYLGERINIDFMGMFLIAGHPELALNSSGVFHHDSVGHRVKLFFPLGVRGNTESPTKYIRESNRIRWKSYLNPVGVDGRRVPSSLTEDTERIESLAGPVGSWYMFDTNGLHKGSYSALTGLRAVLQVEFSTCKGRFLRGEIGAREYFLSDNAYRHFSRHRLVGKGLALDAGGFMIPGKKMLNILQRAY